MTEMQVLKAYVREGRFVIDERTELPEGAEVVLQVVSVDSFAGMDPEERAELEAGIEEGYRDIENGDVVDAKEFIKELLAQSERKRP